MFTRQSDVRSRRSLRVKDTKKGSSTLLRHRHARRDGTFLILPPVSPFLHTSSRFVTPLTLLPCVKVRRPEAPSRVRSGRRRWWNSGGRDGGRKRLSAQGELGHRWTPIRWGTA